LAMAKIFTTALKKKAKPEAAMATEKRLSI
jgi:hypothetical protein